MNIRAERFGANYPDPLSASHVTAEPMSNRLATVFDIFVGLLAVGAAAGIVVTDLFGGGLLRTALVLPTLLFCPGYALVSLLYPDVPGDPATRDRQGWSLTTLERCGLAVAASVAIVPLIALVLNFTPYGIRTVPVVVGVTGVTTVLSLGALVSRFRVSSENRYHPRPLAWSRASVGRYLRAGPSSLRGRAPLEAENNRQRLLNLLVVASVLLLFSSVAYAAVGPTLPSDDGSYTELALLDSEGERLLGTEAPVGGSAIPATIAIENQEGQTESYTVVVQRQQVTVGEERTRVRQSSVVDTYRQTVEDGETVQIKRTFDGGGESVRIQVLLFRGEAPSNPSADDAYRVTRFWPGGN